MKVSWDDYSQYMDKYCKTCFKPFFKNELMVIAIVGWYIYIPLYNPPLRSHTRRTEGWRRNRARPKTWPRHEKTVIYSGILFSVGVSWEY